MAEELDPLFDYSRSCFEIIPLDDDDDNDDDDFTPVIPSKRRKSSYSDVEKAEELDILFDYTRSCLQVIPLDDDDDDDDDSTPFIPSKCWKSSDSVRHSIKCLEVEEVEELDELFDYTRSCLEIVPHDDGSEDDDDNSTLIIPSKRKRRKSSDFVASTMTNTCITSLRSVCYKPSPIHFPKGNNFQACLYRRLHNAPLTALAYPSRPLTWTLSNQLSQSDSPAQRSEEWFALRRDKLTTSTFSTALGFWKGRRRYELWHEKVFISDTESMLTPSSIQAMEWGVVNEAKAIEKYKSITGREVSSLAFATHSENKFDWIGASPDGLLGYSPNLGILEVKCPFNKGKPDVALPWTNMPYYYMPQVQGQMEVMDREWVDLYCWTLNGSTIFHVCRNREYWMLIHGILREFWWENVVPAKEALAMGSEEEALKYEPTSTHKLTGLVIQKSKELASGSKLLCREIAGHIEFFR